MESVLGEAVAADVVEASRSERRGVVDVCQKVPVTTQVLVDVRVLRQNTSNASLASAMPTELGAVAGVPPSARPGRGVPALG